MDILAYDGMIAQHTAANTAYGGTHAGAYRQRYHEQLYRVDYRQRCESRLGVIPDEQAVHDIIERLNELRQHDRRSQLQPHLTDFFLAE